MMELMEINCYIEEYMNTKGQLGVRVRDKITHKKVVISGCNVNKSHFLRFLSQAKLRQYIMPTIFERNGSDVVVICGYKISETNEEIVINIDVNGGGYRFK